MSETLAPQYNRLKLIIAFLTVGIISLIQPGCDCSSTNEETANPSAITSVSPESSSITALVTTDVSAVFLDDMDGATVESGFSLSVNSSPVSATVSYDAATKTATLTPDTDLVSGTQYRAIIASSVKDINGNSPLTTDYIWSFTISPAMLLTSKNTSNVTANDISKIADIDATGRYIVFESEATNLTSVATTANRLHIYRKDTNTGEVVLVSSDASGLVEANNKSGNPSISTNGRYVVFESTATNLDANISSNGTLQIYLKDIDSGAIELMSRDVNQLPDNGASGASNAKVSSDGSLILFQSSDRNLSTIDGLTMVQVYLKDMSDESVEMISRNAADAAGNGNSSNPDMSADGTHIVFESVATNLTTASGFSHIYYVDRNVTHDVEQISVTSNPGSTDANAHSYNPSVSDDGSTVIFDTNATNLDILDINGVSDVYLHYRPSVSTRLVSANLTNTSSGNGASSNAHINGSADYVVFESLASDLVSVDTLGVKDIFVSDLSALPSIITERVNNPVSGLEASAATDNPVISTDGRYVSFHSIVPYTIDDTDTLSDVFRAHNNTHP